MWYNAALLIGILFALPKWLLQKKYHGTILQRLGLQHPPRAEQKTVIWFHMVSVGETRAMIATFRHLKQKYPNADFYLSTTTKTGHEEANRSMPNAKAYFILPIDLSWIMNYLVKRIAPTLFILAESDFWPHLLSAVKRGGGKVVVLNGKISSTSAWRFSKFPHICHKTFQNIDHFYIQSQEYATAFSSLNISSNKMTITGNLKLTTPITPLSKQERDKKRADYGISPNESVITLGSTHKGEEESLLPYLAAFKVFVVPRHPDRFSLVKKLLQKVGNPNFILIDQMGVLPQCYQLSDLAIVGGSFYPGVGGHNIFEPIQAEIPVIFGPYMESQQQLRELILKGEAGVQTAAADLPNALKQAVQLNQNVKDLLGTVNAQKEKVFEHLEQHLPCP